MQSYEGQSLILNFLDHVQIPHCRGHSPPPPRTVADISPTVADISPTVISTVADTFTSVITLGYM